MLSHRALLIPVVSVLALHKKDERAIGREEEKEEKKRILSLFRSPPRKTPPRAMTDRSDRSTSCLQHLCRKRRRFSARLHPHAITLPMQLHTVDPVTPEHSFTHNNLPTPRAEMLKPSPRDPTPIDRLPIRARVLAPRNISLKGNNQSPYTNSHPLPPPRPVKL